MVSKLHPFIECLIQTLSRKGKKQLPLTNRFGFVTSTRMKGNKGIHQQVKVIIMNWGDIEFNKKE